MPEVARHWGFFYRLRATTNPWTVRLRSHNCSPDRLEMFLVATTPKWQCYVGEDELHCRQCSQRQQRECAAWVLARTSAYWRRLYSIKSLSKRFLENNVARRARHGLFLSWLHLKRVYKISEDDINREADVIASRRRRRNK